MAVVSGDLLRMVLKFADTHSSQLQNVFHFIAGGPEEATNDDVLDALSGWAIAAYTDISGAIRNDVSFIEGIVDRVVFLVDAWEVAERVGIIDALSGLSFINVGEALPPATAALIRFPTTVPKHEGKKYIGGLGETNNDDDGTPAATLIANLALSSLDMMAEANPPVADCPLMPVILDADQNLYRYFNTAIVPNEWAYQRRRKVGTGV